MSMKNIFKIVALAALIVSCSKKEIELPEQDMDSPDFLGVTYVDTKVSYEDTDNSFKLSWIEDDRIGIWTSVEGAVLRANSQYKATESTATSPFTPISRGLRIRWNEDGKPQSFYACAPYKEGLAEDYTNVEVSLSTEQEQTALNDPSKLAIHDFMWAATENVTKPENNEVQLNFKHLFSVIDLELVTDARVKVDGIILKTKTAGKPLAFSGGKVNLATGALNLEGAEAKDVVRLNCGYATLANVASHYYIMFNPALASETIDIYAEVNGKEVLLASRTTPAAGLNKGKVYVVKASYAVPEEDYLPIVDLSKDATSNCYLVTQADNYYKFRATVKGNAYVPSELAGVVTSTDIEPKSALVLWYNTQQSTQSWIDANPIVIGSVVLNDGYIYFDTPKDFVNGNVVIAAFAEEGLTYDNITVDANYLINNATILWSWNIWAVEGLDLDAEAKTVTYTPESGTPVTYTVMDRNLGATLNGKDIPTDDPKGIHAACAIGNHYQWGRKDPFPPVSDYAHLWPTSKHGLRQLCNPTFTPIKALRKVNPLPGIIPDNPLFIPKDIESYSGTGATDASLYRFDKATVSFAQAIAAVPNMPYMYFRHSQVDIYNKHWFPNSPQVDPWKHLWGDKDYADGLEAVKTLFDPCPIGWKLWQSETVEAFVQEGGAAATFATTGKGLMVNGSYFAFNGGGSNEDFSYGYGDVFLENGLGPRVGLWTATAKDRENNQILQGNDWYYKPGVVTINSVTVQFDAKVAGGMNVRCIKE